MDLPIYQDIHWNGNISYTEGIYWFSNGSNLKCIDKEDNLWIGNAPLGLLKIANQDTVQLRGQSSLFFHHLNEVINPKDSLLYIAITAQGIIEIKGDKISSHGADMGLSSNVCYALT